MPLEDLQRVAFTPLPPYEGIDLGLGSTEGMYPGGENPDVELLPGDGGGGAAPSFPFTLKVVDGDIILTEGSIDFFIQAEVTEPSAADGRWYAYAKVVIDATTGAYSSRSTLLTSSAQSNSSTDYYGLIADVTIASGEIIVPVIQYNYGPIRTYRYGAVDDKWGVEFI